MKQQSESAVALRPAVAELSKATKNGVLRMTASKSPEAEELMDDRGPARDGSKAAASARSKSLPLSSLPLLALSDGSL